MPAGWGFKIKPMMKKLIFYVGLILLGCHVVRAEKNYIGEAGYSYQNYRIVLYWKDLIMAWEIIVDYL